MDERKAACLAELWHTLIWRLFMQRAVFIWMPPPFKAAEIGTVAIVRNCGSIFRLRLVYVAYNIHAQF